MRRNSFGEAYCANAQEVLEELERKEIDAAGVYLCEINRDKKSYWGDVRENIEGEIVLYIEAGGTESVKLIAAEVGIEDQS